MFTVGRSDWKLGEGIHTGEGERHKVKGLPTVIGKYRRGRESSRAVKL